MLNKQNTGLIVVDIQGKLARLVSDSQVMISNCETLIKGTLVLGLPIIVLQQNPDKLGITVGELSPLLINNPVINKLTFNACDEPQFIEAITASNIDTWLVCGIEAHICVYQTTLGLLQRGYQVQLVSDCIASRQQSNKKLAINILANKGVQITAVEMCLFELVKDCQSTEFKQILNLIK